MSTIISACPVCPQLSRPDMASAVESVLSQIKRTTDELLQRANDPDPSAAQAIRSEAQRLNGIGFTLTRLLCLDDIEAAYRIIDGDANDSGEVLGTLP